MYTFFYVHAVSSTVICFQKIQFFGRNIIDSILFTPEGVDIRECATNQRKENDMASNFRYVFHPAIAHKEKEAK